MKFNSHFPKTAALAAVGLSALMTHTVVYGMLEEVVVTAQKREESLSDVPIAVTAFTGDTMKKLGVTNASDLVDITPGLSSGAQTGSNRNYYLRGVGTQDVHITAASAVGQYFDDITLTSGFHAKAALFDMDRVEILKGPQNTLFGLNTTGGAVNYISNKPEVGAGIQGSGTLKVGNNEHVEGDFAIGFDVSDNLAARVALQLIQDDGAFKSINNGENYGDSDVLAGRLTLLWQPTDVAQVTFNLRTSESENNSTAIKAVGTRAANGVDLCDEAPRGVVDFEKKTDCYSRNGGGTNEMPMNPSTDDWEKIAQDIGMEDISTFGTYLKFDYELEWATLTSLTSWDNLEYENANDNDGGDTLGLTTFHADDRDTFQQELRLISPADEAFRWIAGLYYLDEEADSYTGLRGARNAFGNGVRIPNVQLDNTKENLGIYFQGEYDFNDVTTLTLGVRYSEEEIVGDYLPSCPSVAGVDTHTLYFADDVDALVRSGTRAPCNRNDSSPDWDANNYDRDRQVTQTLENDDVGYTLKLDWRPTEDSLVYASISKGFKGSALDIRPVYALVPSANAEQSLEGTQLEPESLDAYEIGYKGTFYDGRIRLDASAFLYNYENLQQFSTAQQIAVLINAPESEIMGLDANIVYGGDSGLTLQAGLSMLDSEVTDGVADGMEVFHEGAELASTPDISFNLLASQDIVLGNGDILNLTANIAHTGDQTKWTAVPGNKDVIDQLTQEAYTLLNASVSYYFGRDQQFSVSAYANNLTDEHYCAHILANDSNNILRESTNTRTDVNQVVLCRVTNASTRTYGASISYEF